MASYLSIIERAYRATIEEQDDVALWFSHAMKSGGAQVAVLLRGDAVAYASKAQSAGGLRFGDLLVKGPSLARDVTAMIERGIRVFVVPEDAAARGIRGVDMVPGVEVARRGALAKIITEFDCVIRW
jgi:predicted peroxiredoxin